MESSNSTAVNGNVNYTFGNTFGKRNTADWHDFN